MNDSSLHQSQKVRVRFAPSPTGHLHIGGLRSALFNWLFARHMQGDFLLRIEDTDVERSKDEYTQAIYQAFAWVGITSDEQPLIQSQRFSLYQECAHHLLAQKKAYYCVCTPEEVEARIRAKGLDGDYHGGYDGFCRDKDRGSVEGAGIRFVVQQQGEPFAWHDAIRGSISFERSQLDDFIIIRADGTPTYNFCVVIDDHASKITHVIRGEDHISNTPKQIALYQAFEYQLPVFAHIPMILGSDGNKLSKRDGAVDVLAYRAMGYLPDALLNYIARLGWSHGDQEIFTVEELIQYFDLHAVGKKPSIFDYTKLEWLNSVYMREKSPEYVMQAIADGIDAEFAQKLVGWSKETRMYAIQVYQGRTKNLVELRQELLGLYHGPVEYNQQDVATYTDHKTGSLLTDIVSLLEQYEMHEYADRIKQYAKDCHYKFVQVAQPIRLALTGGTSSPGIFELMTILGKQENIKRLQAFYNFLQTVSR